MPRSSRRPSVSVARFRPNDAITTRDPTPAVLENEISNAVAQNKHHREVPGVFMGIVQKHRQLVQKREDHRRAKRKAKFDSLTPGEQEAAQAGEDTATPSLSSSTDDVYSRDVADALEVVDPQVSTVAALTDMTRSIVVPAQFAGSPPVVRLDDDDESTLAQSTTTGVKRRTGITALDKHVAKRIAQRDRHLAILKGVLKGVWTFVKTPLGIIVAIYGFLVIFSGAGLVICLAGWVPGDKDKQVEVFSQATNALFTITGVGFIPWRCKDTYLIARICHYRNLSNKLRRRKNLAPLDDANDLAFEAGIIEHPATTPSAEDKIMLPPITHEDEHMLTPTQAAKLRYCQTEFAKSCTWYRATETPTHRAFPIGTAVTVTAFTIGNSLFQCLMCGFMWGYATHYKDVS